MSRAHTQAGRVNLMRMGKISVNHIGELVALAESRCLLVEDLAPIVLNAFCSDKHPDSRGFYDAWRDADDINKLGVTEQVFWLVEEFGFERAEEIIRSKGGILLALARAAAEGDNDG